MSERTPYREIDAPVRGLVRVLNRFPGVHTYSSCGGHAEPDRDDRASAGEWYIDSHIDRDGEGHAALEFFAWVAYQAAPAGVEFRPYAKPPHLNRPGSMLFYRWAGVDPDDPDCTPAAFAALLTDLRRTFYVTAARARKWGEEQ